jgi:branched-chain amino acid transport system substrate-binding protein
MTLQKSRLCIKSRYIFIATLVSAVLVVFLSGASQANGASPVNNVIRIGGNFDLSGRYAYYGEAVVNGAKLAFKQANDAGGVLGRKIEFVPLDNASDKAKTAVVMKSLVARGNVSVVLGCLTTANTEMAYVIAEQNRIPIISPTASGFICKEADGKLKSYAFVTCLTEPSEATAMARFAFEEMGYKTAAIVFTEKLEASRALATAFEQVFTGLGGKVVAKEQVVSRVEASQEYVSTIMKAEPEVIYISLGYRDGGRVIRCLREAGVRTPLLGPSEWQWKGIVAYAGEEALNDVYYFGHYATSDKLPKYKAFREAYAQAYKQPADSFAGMGYEAAVVLIAAIREAGSADSEAIRTVLEGIEVEGLLGTIRIDAENHNAIKPAIIYRMVEGQPLPHKLFKP